MLLSVPILLSLFTGRSSPLRLIRESNGTHHQSTGKLKASTVPSLRSVADQIWGNSYARGLC